VGAESGLLPKREEVVLGEGGLTAKFEEGIELGDGGLVP